MSSADKKASALHQMRVERTLLFLLEEGTIECKWDEDKQDLSFRKVQVQ